MKKVVEIRNVRIGEGIPKICVPLVGKDKQRLVEEINDIKALNIDLVEWRSDYYKGIEDKEKVKQILEVIRKALGEIPLLATFRSKKEGGEKELTTEEYIKLNKSIIASGKVDLIDIELYTGEEEVKELIAFAHEYHVKVVMSNHDFNKTPNKEEIINRLCQMQRLDADLLKIAVMPQTAEDVLTLLAATNEMFTQYANRPIITMAMAGMGMISRLAGEVFGSAITFGNASLASAPGQIPITKLHEMLHIIHENK